MESAYVALLSLSSNIELSLQNISLIFREKLQIESLNEKTTFLIHFFEDHHISRINRQEILDLEIRTKYVALEADCMIDCLVMDQNQMLIKNGFSSGNNSSKMFPDEAIHRIINEFESIQEEALKKIIEDVKAKEEAQQSNLVTPNSPTRSAPGRVDKNTTMVGFEQHLVAVMERVTGHAFTLQILPILGMGGIGKTALAKNVFDNQLIVEHFDIRIWATVSQSFNVHEILLSFLHDLKIVHENIVSLHELGDKLYKTLFGRRYLIVMDDIWDNKAWDEIRRFFPKNDNGSRIILTTRHGKVALDIGSCDPYKLEYLDEDESWNLLEANVFGKNRCPYALEEVGRRIATSCKGLPLPIVVIAGHLAKLDLENESWEGVAGALDSIIHSENDSECPKILSLSYDNLPLYLKPCFLYMAFYSKGSELWPSYVIKDWVANGILKPIRDQCLEDTAMQYLTDLVERNLISVTKRGPTGKIKKFRIHDLLHDLCQRKSSEHKFLNDGIVENERTLGMETNSEYNVPLSLFSVRSFENDLSSFLWSVKGVLQVAVFNLLEFRLRHIKLSSSPSTDVSTFSSLLAKISMFQNLQTLLIEETPVGNEPLVLPLEIWEMARLRHLIIKQVAMPDPSIAHDVDGKEGPILANLQTLQDVHCFKLSEEVVKRIPNLKKLKLTYTKASESTVEWSYYGLHNLAKLCKLKSLSFAVREKITALEFSLPLSLRKLILDGCKLPWEEMTMVGSLPNLEVLRLQNDAFCGREWKPIEGEFCHLKVLHLRNMSFQQWEADRTHFPRLERLILYNVWWLKEIPLDIGDIPTLQFISADCCRSSLEVSVEQLIEEQRSMENNGIQVATEIGFSSLLIMNFVRIFQNYLLHFNNHPPHESGVMIEKFEDNLHELQNFISYTTMKMRTDERLKELMKHIRDMMYEAADVYYTVQLHKNKGKWLNYSFRRMVNVVKEVEYVAVKVQRLRLLVGDRWDEEEFGSNKDLRDLIDCNTEDEAYNFLLRQLISQHLNKMYPDWLKDDPEHAKYLEPKSSSRVQVIFRDFAVLTDVDGISVENELVHLGYTCDNCEIHPIVGVRYSCKDCYVEYRGGFDLCEECYSSGLVSDHTGPCNNLKHTSEHVFEIL